MGSMKKRFGLLGVVVSLAAIAVLSLDVPVTEGQGGGGALILAVSVDSFDGPEPGTAGPFNVEGTITAGGTGTFQCWGWVKANEATNVSQVYNIDSRGAIMTQGEEGGLLAVVGGTDDFRNVRGEGLQVFNADFSAFTIAFDIQGAGP